MSGGDLPNDIFVEGEFADNIYKHHTKYQNHCKYKWIINHRFSGDSKYFDNISESCLEEWVNQIDSK